MVFCGNCGKEIEERDEYCPQCGAPQHVQPYRSPQSYDSGSIGWYVLGFCIPLVGLILFLVWQRDRPHSANMSGVGALTGVIADVISTIVFLVIFFSLGSIEITSSLF